MSGRCAAIVLAAGAATRFGGAKVAADLDGRPVLRWVLDAIDRAGVREVVLVLGAGSDEVERAIGPGRERRVLNPDPSAGLAGSLRLGLAALDPAVEVALVALGDQPLVRADVIADLIARAVAGPRPVVVPRYAADGSRNPVALRREAFALAAAATGDRGLGPVLETHPELVAVMPVEGDNPDIDTAADLARLRDRAPLRPVRGGG